MRNSPAIRHRYSGERRGRASGVPAPTREGVTRADDGIPRDTGGRLHRRRHRLLRRRSSWPTRYVWPRGASTASTATCRRASWPPRSWPSSCWRSASGSAAPARPIAPARSTGRRWSASSPCTSRSADVRRLVLAGRTLVAALHPYPAGPLRPPPPALGQARVRGPVPVVGHRHRDVRHGVRVLTRMTGRGRRPTVGSVASSGV